MCCSSWSCSRARWIPSSPPSRANPRSARRFPSLKAREGGLKRVCAAIWCLGKPGGDSGKDAGNDIELPEIKLSEIKSHVANPMVFEPEHLARLTKRISELEAALQKERESSFDRLSAIVGRNEEESKDGAVVVKKSRRATTKI